MNRLARIKKKSSLRAMTKSLNSHIFSAWVISHWESSSASAKEANSGGWEWNRARCKIPFEWHTHRLRCNLTSWSHFRNFHYKPLRWSKCLSVFFISSLVLYQFQFTLKENVEKQKAKYKNHSICLCSVLVCLWASNENATFIYFKGWTGILTD